MLVSPKQEAVASAEVTSSLGRERAHLWWVQIMVEFMADHQSAKVNLGDIRREFVGEFKEHSEQLFAPGGVTGFKATSVMAALLEAAAAVVASAAQLRTNLTATHSAASNEAVSFALEVATQMSERYIKGNTHNSTSQMEKAWLCSFQPQCNGPPQHPPPVEPVYSQDVKDWLSPTSLNDSSMAAKQQCSEKVKDDTQAAAEPPPTVADCWACIKILIANSHGRLDDSWTCCELLSVALVVMSFKQAPAGQYPRLISEDQISSTVTEAASSIIEAARRAATELHKAKPVTNKAWPYLTGHRQLDGLGTFRMTIQSIVSRVPEHCADSPQLLGALMFLWVAALY